MKISRFLKTILMTDFIGGLLIAIKELFKSKKTINYPFEKGKISPSRESFVVYGRLEKWTLL